MHRTSSVPGSELLLPLSLSLSLLLLPLVLLLQLLSASTNRSEAMSPPARSLALESPPDVWGETRSMVLPAAGGLLLVAPLLQMAAALPPESEA